LKGLDTAHMANGDIHELCMTGTREKILEEARAWRASEDPDTPQIFWLADVAGSGKSTVAKHISGEWKTQGRLAGRFFFSRDAEETRTIKLFFSTIAQQGLSHLGSSVRSAISDGIRELCGPSSAPLEEQCRELFVRPLSKVTFPTVLVLDALDECDQTTLTRLFRILLAHLPNLPYLKLFLASRPDKHIAKILDIPKVRRMSLRDDEVSNAKDVTIFMREKLSSFSLPVPLIDKLVKRSQGLFIWASTVCRLIDDFQGDMDEYVGDLLMHGPDQMDSIYQKALDQALPPADQKANRRAYMKVLGIIVVAFEPLSPETINEMLKISNTLTIVQHLKSVLDCRHLDDPVRFLHPTFREFLLGCPSVNLYHIDERLYHVTLLHGCLETMSHRLCHDICDLFDILIHEDIQIKQVVNDVDEPKFNPMLKPACLAFIPNRLQGQPLKQTPERICLDREVAQDRLSNKTCFSIRYSCRFWGVHLACSLSFGPSIMELTIDRVKNFFSHNLLDWIYIISIMGAINEVKPVLQKLISANMASFMSLNVLTLITLL
jgi:hypothetical protein